MPSTSRKIQDKMPKSKRVQPFAISIYNKKSQSDRNIQAPSGFFKARIFFCQIFPRHRP